MSKNEENLRTEYSALSQYHNSLVTFRLTLLGLFLAALGLLIGKDWPISPHICVLGLLLTFCMYIFELRTRVLFESIARRGVEIEQGDWKIESETPTKQRFYSLQYPKKEIINYGIDLKIFGKISIKDMPILKNIRLSHSVALDYLYTGLIFFFLFSLVFSILATPQPSQTPTPTVPATVTAINPTSSATFTPTLIATPTKTDIPTIIINATDTP